MTLNDCHKLSNIGSRQIKEVINGSFVIVNSSMALSNNVSGSLDVKYVFNNFIYWYQLNIISRCIFVLHVYTISIP